MADPVISILNNLVEVCRNGERGFREASESVRDAHLATLFLELSEQRHQFAAQLRYHISRLGERPANRGTVAGALHRRWIDVRSTVSARSHLVVISECERGEDFARKTYERALRHDLPSEIRPMIEEQFAQVKSAHDTIRALQLKLRDQPAY